MNFLHITSSLSASALELGTKQSISSVSVISTQRNIKRLITLEHKPILRVPIQRQGQRTIKRFVTKEHKPLSVDSIQQTSENEVKLGNGVTSKYGAINENGIPTILNTSKINEYKPLSMVAIQQKRYELLSHPVYKVLNHPDHVRIFMKHHVFAVWDFMSLLKRLQQQLTCVSVPWVPPTNIKFARFINEIVLGEETDVNLNGDYISHFDLYLQAMNEVNADTKPILNFLSQLKRGTNIEQCLLSYDIPTTVNKFVTNTVRTAITGHPHEVAASFFFGREEVIPDMFRMMVKHIENQGGKADRLMYYLDRHITVDGDEHGPLAEKLLVDLCENDEVKRKEVEKVAINALSMRVELWNGVLQEIKQLYETDNKIII